MQVLPLLLLSVALLTIVLYFYESDALECYDFYLWSYSQTSELEAWEEENNAWENEEAAEDLTWQAEEAIRETRRKERAQRVAQNQRRKQQREQEKGRTNSGGGGVSIATRVS